MGFRLGFKTDDPLVGLLCASFVLAVAMRAIWLLLWSVIQGEASEKWPTAEGVVLDSWVEDKATKHGTEYLPVVRYRYTWAGREWKGTRLAFSDTSQAGPREAKRIVDQFKAASRVEVRVDPAQPKRSVLIAGYGERPWPAILALAVVTTVASVMVAVELTRYCR